MYQFIILLMILINYSNGILVNTTYGTWSMTNINGSLIPDSPSFMVDETHKQFLLDGHPFQYISGSIHYFRIPRSQWKDRLSKVRALGFNAIQYYIPWNLHEIEPRDYHFEGLLDFGEFSQMAHQMGLWTILRIGPYICGEWENGGLPAWLLNRNVGKQRTLDAVYITEVERWFEILLPRVIPLLRKNGGPVLMVQIENEYGSYDGCDHKYMQFLRDLTKQYLGDDVLLFTTDGPSENMLKCGTIEGVLPTIDFGPTNNKTEIERMFSLQRKYAPTGPYVNSEYYPGWLVLWGQRQQSLPSPDTIITGANHMYTLGANINFYMIHGGTNFGFWNGAETDAPCITSYDYSAPITEAGDVTSNYLNIRKWIKSLPEWTNKPMEVPENTEKTAFGMVKMRMVHNVMTMAGLMDAAGECKDSKRPMSFENLNHTLGLVIYHSTIPKCGNLTIPQFADFASVYINKKYMGTLYNKYYNLTTRSLSVEGCEDQETHISILVENQGRRTYETINDYKGILSDVLIDGQPIYEWNQCGVKLPIQSEKGYKQYMRRVEKQMMYQKNVKLNQRQGVYMGEVKVDKQTDTFIDMSGWGKGIVIINGHNIGRYWSTQGPQITLFIPSEFLKFGPNLVMIIELEGATDACSDTVCQVNFIDHPIFKFDTIKYFENENLLV